MSEWLGVVGTRELTVDVGRDVHLYVERAVRSGSSIVSGGGTGVDTMAIKTAIELDVTPGRLRVYLPVQLARYAELLLLRAEAGKCLVGDAEETIAQLQLLRARDEECVVDGDGFTELTPEAFYARNQRILDLASRLAAFQIRGNPTASKLIAGTAYTVQLAHERGMPVDEFEYDFAE